MQNDFLRDLDNELDSVLTPINNNTISLDKTKEYSTWIEDSPEDENNVFLSLKDTMMSNFPQMKFYLPTLRDWYTRVIPVWWNNETWSKNMDMFQYEEDILLVDCGIQFAEPDMLWATCSIPDISFLIPYKKKIVWLVITHAHLDHIWSLKYVLPALDYPVIYWTKLTVWIIKKWLDENKMLDKQRFIEVSSDSSEKIKIWQFDCEFFRVNHSIPDCAWVHISTPGGFKAVHTWDFKIDFAPEIDKPADLSRIWAYWREWVTLLLSDSTWSTRKWFSISEKEIWETLEKIIAHHSKWRLIIAMFSSWISRVQQIIKSCEKYDKSLFLSGRSISENIEISKELWYIKVKQGTIKKMSPKTTAWIPLEKQVIITTWSQWEEFSALSRMAEWKHPSIEIMSWDTIIFSSSVVPGNERSVYSVINKLIKLWANVITKDDREVHTWGHAFQEEQKIMLNLVKPKYFMPVYWDLYFRHAHKKTAMAIWMEEENILLLDNWNIVDFGPDGKVFKSRIKVPIQDIIIDWHWIWTTTSHVIQAREKMMNSWVVTIIFKIDSKTKAIISPIKLESRWLVYLEEVRIIHKIIVKKARSIYENTIKDVPEIEEKDLLKIIKTDLEAYLLQKIDREPMIIPMIVEI